MARDSHDAARASIILIPRTGSSRAQRAVRIALNDQHNHLASALIDQQKNLIRFSGSHQVLHFNLPIAALLIFKSSLSNVGPPGQEATDGQLTGLRL